MAEDVSPALHPTSTMATPTVRMGLLSRVFLHVVRTAER